MITNFIKTSKQILGGSLSLPAHGWSGARATSFLAAHFAKQNTNSVGVQSEGEAEGGCGGNSASPEPKRSPAVLLEEAGHHKKILFSLGEKEIRRAQNEKSKEYFSVVVRAERAAAGRIRSSVQRKFAQILE